MYGYSSAHTVANYDDWWNLLIPEESCDNVTDIAATQSKGGYNVGIGIRGEVGIR